MTIHYVTNLNELNNIVSQIDDVAIINNDKVYIKTCESWLETKSHNINNTLYQIEDYGTIVDTKLGNYSLHQQNAWVNISKNGNTLIKVSENNNGDLFLNLGIAHGIKYCNQTSNIFFQIYEKNTNKIIYEIDTQGNIKLCGTISVGENLGNITDEPI